MSGLARALSLAVAAVLLLRITVVFPKSLAAHSYTLGSLEIGHVWAKPAEAGGDAVIFAPIFNTGSEPATLVSVSSSVAETATFRAAVEKGNERLDAVELPVGDPVALAPWRAHILLTGLNTAL